MKYNYKDHKDIDPLMNDYLLAVNKGDVACVEEMSLEEINNFLNELEDWYVYMSMWTEEKL